MHVLGGLRIGQKLGVLRLFPTLGLLLFAGILGFNRYGQWAESKRLASLTTLSVRVGALVHELQRERGSTALFLGSKGVKFGEEVAKIQATSDGRLRDLDRVLDGIDSWIAASSTPALSRSIVSALFGGVGGRRDRRARMDDSAARHLEGEHRLTPHGRTRWPKKPGSALGRVLGAPSPSRHRHLNLQHS